MQTLQMSMSGVSLRTGRILGGFASRHVQRQMVVVMRQRLLGHGGTSKAVGTMLPIYDRTGEVVGYERSMAPQRSQAPVKNTRLGKMIGAWTVHQADEKLAQSFNGGLVDRL